MTNNNTSASFTPLGGDAVLQALNWRYATKVFDATRKLSPEQWQILEQALVLTPSSYGLQPWRFVNVADSSVREQLKAVSWNQAQVVDASHLVVLAARETVTVDDVTVLMKTTAQTRKVLEITLEPYRQMIMFDLVNGARSKMAFEWAARQCYIALGNLMTSAAMLGVDTCPMEGLDPSAYDRILGLGGTGYRTVVACALGFRSAEDKYARLPKVRYPAEEVVKNC